MASKKDVQLERAAETESNPFADVPSETVKCISEMTKRAIGPRCLALLDREFVLHDGKVVDARTLLAPHKVTPLALASLTGLVNYLKSNVDALEQQALAVLVQGPGEVSLVSKLAEAEQRQCYVKVNLPAESFQFSRYMDQQSFIIGLLTQFVDTPDRAVLVALASKLVQGEQVEAEDDGIGQTVTLQARAGVKERAQAKSIHVLAPYRTFREVEQPASPFLLRVQGVKDQAPTLALFEADGGAWKNEARSRVQAYLEVQLESAKVITTVLA